jgi:hypothetical protein
MHEIALTLKWRRVDVVHASRYAGIRSQRASAEMSVSSINWALIGTVRNEGRVLCGFYSLCLNTVYSARRKEAIEVIIESCNILFRHYCHFPTKW